MIICMVHTTPNHNPPEMDVLLKTFLQVIQVRPPNSSNDLCLPFCLFLLLCIRVKKYSNKNGPVYKQTHVQPRQENVGRENNSLGGFFQEAEERTA